MNRKPYSQRKRTTAKSVLRLPHLRHAKSMRGCGRIDDNAEIIQMRTERISLGRGLQEPIFALGLPPDAWALSGARAAGLGYRTFWYTNSSKSRSVRMAFSS
jgi:hypothetical protein